MEVYWYIIISLALVGFFILDGYDFGVGIIHLFFAEEEKDKVVIAKSAGLFWDANEVWLVMAGGMLFMAFPLLYASAFSGFYLPLMMLLWLMIFRAIGLELRGQYNTRIWRDMCDKAFGVSSFLLALLFGVALGNIIRGVNLGGVVNGVSKYESSYFFLPLWNARFSPLAHQPGVIDWFTLIFGFITVITLMIHGANWIVLKTNSSINDRLKNVVYYLNIGLILLSLASIWMGYSIQSDPLGNFITHPGFSIFPLFYILGLSGLFFVRRYRRPIYAFLFSTLVIFGGITTSLASIFPKVLPSTNMVHPALTIYNTAAGDYSLSVAALWSVMGMLLMVLYFIIQRRLLSGKIDTKDYGH